MEESPSLWNKTANEVTVKDQVVLALVVPAIMVGGTLAIAAVSSGVNAVRTRIQRRKERLQENVIDVKEA